MSKEEHTQFLVNIPKSLIMRVNHYSLLEHNELRDIDKILKRCLEVGLRSVGHADWKLVSMIEVEELDE
jgi:hypothetical protein